MYKIQAKTYTLLAAFSGAAIASAMLSACQASPLFCTTATNDHLNAVRLKKTSGDDNCLPEVISVGMETYLGKGPGRPDFAKAGVVLTDATLRGHYDRAVGQAIIEADFDKEKDFHATGDFEESHPDENDLCGVDKLTTTIELPPVPAVPDDPATDADDGLPALDGFTRTYEWSDFKVEISPAIQGTVFWAKLKFSADIVPEGGGEASSCSAEYEAAGIWGDTTCASGEVDECFCQADADGDVPKPGSKDCKATAITEEFKGKIDCVAGACVLKKTKR